jgi:hypothetical protein
MKITKQKLKQIIKEELEEAYGGALGPFPDRYGDAHKQQAGLTPDELENFLDTYVVDNPLYSLDGETSKSLFASYVRSIGRVPPDVEALQDMYDSLARNMDPEDRSHMSDLMEIIKEELEGFEEDPEQDDSWPAAEDIEDAIQMLNAEVEDNGDQSGTLFHVINRLEVALDKLGELAPVKLSTPKEDPWKFKKRLGIGGSVHDRLGGPREKK